MCEYIRRDCDLENEENGFTLTSYPNFGEAEIYANVIEEDDEDNAESIPLLFLSITTSDGSVKDHSYTELDKEDLLVLIKKLTELSNLM